VALQWTSALSVGVPEIDAQHRELFARVDRLLDAVLRRDRAAAIQLMAFLREYTVVHFAAEEQLMEQSGFREMEAHLLEHRRFTAALRILEADYRAEGATADVVYRLEREAVDWLRNHVLSTDQLLARWVLAGHAVVAQTA
jgi:hemerythrin